MGGRCAVAAAVALWTGMLLARGADGLLASCLAAVLGVLAWRAPPRLGTVLALATLALAGAARAVGHEAALASARRGLATEGALYRIEGVVAAPPLRASGMPDAIVAVVSATPPIATGARLRVRFPEGVRIAWGDRVRALAWVERPAGIRNPGGRDARGAADGAGIVATGRARFAEITPARGPSGWASATVERWRGAIERRLDRRLVPAARDLVVPFVLGDRSGMPADLGASFRAAGLVHLLALSGLHVSWMAGAARGLVACAGGGIVARALAGAACALLYVGLAGPLPSLARAASTEVFRAAAGIGQRALDPLQALAVSSIALLAIAPGWSADVGFQLSCAATVGIIVLGPRLVPRGRWRPVGELLGMTVAAQWTTLGLLLHHFRSFSWIALFSNLIAVPLSGLLLAAAWIALAVDLALPGAGGAWFHACEAIASALAAVSAHAARVPGSLVASGPDAAPALFAAAGAALAVWACATARPGIRDEASETRARCAARAAGVWATLLAVALTASAPPLVPPPGRFWVVVLDVGQGDAIALGFEDGWWLVDTGPSGPTYDAGEYVVAAFMRWAGVRRLEALALTHGDRDHVGGTTAVRRALAVKRVWTASGGAGRSGAAAGPRALRAAWGDTLRSEPPVTVLWPPRDTPRAGEANATGLVLEVGRGAGRVLLLADVDSTVEARLAFVAPVALLKVAHHGSRSSSGATFLARARPRAAMISCGRRNPFGHPHPDVIARLNAAGARIHRTDREGALWFEIGEDVTRLDWRSLRPGRAGGSGGSGGSGRDDAPLGAPIPRP